MFCTGKCGKYNRNTSQQSTDTARNFNSDLSKVSDLPLSASEKTVTATVCCFNSNPEFLSLCSDKFVITTRASSLNSGKSINGSNLNTVGEPLCAIVTGIMLQLIGQRHHSFLT